MGRPILDRAQCHNCPAPLEKSYGAWVHHWIYKNACRDPKPIQTTIEPDYGK